MKNPNEILINNLFFIIPRKTYLIDDVIENEDRLCMREQIVCEYLIRVV